MPINNLSLGSLLLQPITSAAAAGVGFTSPYPAFASQRGANTVYQSLRPYPQYTGVTTGGGVFFGGPGAGGVADPVGQSKYNSLQVKANRRFSQGLTLFGFVTWSKGFTMVLDQYPGQRIYQLDAQPATTFSFSWVYQLPFGQGTTFDMHSRIGNAIVGGWKINGFVKYASGLPLSIAGAGGNLAAVGYTQRGNAISGVNPHLVTDPGKINPVVDRYLNAAAFSASTGFNFGTLAPNLSWVRGFWNKQEALTLARTFKFKDRWTFDVSADAQNPFNLVRFSDPVAATGGLNRLSASFGAITASQPGRTLQINAAIKSEEAHESSVRASDLLRRWSTVICSSSCERGGRQLGH